MNQRAVLQTASTLVVCAVLCLTTGGCDTGGKPTSGVEQHSEAATHDEQRDVQPDEQRDVQQEAQPPEPAAALPDLTPLRLGLTRAKVEALYPEAQKSSRITGPAETCDALRVTLANGAEVSVVFDPKRKVFALHTRDPRVRITDAVGIGTPYADILAAFPQARQGLFLGYGYIVETLPDVWICFNWRDVEIGADDQVIPPAETTPAKWIEVREDTWFDLAAPRQ